LVVVRSHEAHGIRTSQTAIDDQDWDACCLSVVDWGRQSLVVERSEDDAIDLLRGEVLDNLDLLFAVVLFLRAFPNDLDIPQFCSGFLGAGVN
jgi:hypothetical protein